MKDAKELLSVAKRTKAYINELEDALDQAIEAVRLLNSMVESGEKHSQKSRDVVRAIKNLGRLR